MSRSSSQNNTFCYDLPIAVGNSTFCGLTEKWSPRFSEGKLLAMTITPVLLYWIILLLIVKEILKLCFKMWRNNIKETIKFECLDGVKQLFEEEKNEISCCCRLTLYINIFHIFSTLKRSCIYGILMRAKSWFSLIFLMLVKYFWDAIDLTLDVYIFYRLEKGDILDAAGKVAKKWT